jgi:uncharacterized OB-fold protein
MDVTRAIQSAAAIIPAWAQEGFRVLGPDEDLFTQGVEAAESVLASRPSVAAPSTDRLARIDLIGNFDSDAEWAFPEALGFPDLVVRRVPEASDPVLKGLATAVERAEGADLVIAATAERKDGRGSITSGAGAVAFWIQEGPGAVLSPFAASSLPGPVGRWDATESSVLPNLVLLAEEGPIPKPLSPLPPSPLLPSLLRASRFGPTPYLAAADGLEQLTRTLPVGGRGVLTVVQQNSAVSVEVRLEQTIPWLGAWERVAPSIPSPTAPEGGGLSEPATSVSEGAYVPWATYRENLRSRWRLVADDCLSCQQLNFPARGYCRKCGETENLRPRPLSRESLPVVASTAVHPGAQPTEFDSHVARVGAYGVVLVELAPSLRATLQVTGPSRVPLPIGSAVDARLRRLYSMEGRWRYGLKAVERFRGTPVPVGTLPPSSSEVPS